MPLRSKSAWRRWQKPEGRARAGRESHADQAAIGDGQAVTWRRRSGQLLLADLPLGETPNTEQDREGQRRGMARPRALSPLEMM